MPGIMPGALERSREWKREFERTHKHVKIGREYPQGWGRTIGPEPAPEPDGKVDIYGWVPKEPHEITE
jgi:hypothetical protein